MLNLYLFQRILYTHLVYSWMFSHQILPLILLTIVSLLCSGSLRSCLIRWFSSCDWVNVDYSMECWSVALYEYYEYSRLYAIFVMEFICLCCSFMGFPWLIFSLFSFSYNCWCIYTEKSNVEWIAVIIIYVEFQFGEFSIKLVTWFGISYTSDGQSTFSLACTKPVGGLHHVT